MQALMASISPTDRSTSRNSKAPPSEVSRPPRKSAWMFLRLRLENSRGCVVQSAVEMAFLLEYRIGYNSLLYKQLGHLSIQKYGNPVKYAG